MRSLRELLRRQPPQETPCPRCGVPAPPGDVECTACGWDLRDAYHDPRGEAEKETVAYHDPRGEAEKETVASDRDT